MDLWKISADGREQRRLTSNGNRNQQPYVSDDGRTIAFVTLGRPGNHIWMMNGDGSIQDK
jgi:Tol biopolymer transport system component